MSLVKASEINSEFIKVGSCYVNPVVHNLIIIVTREWDTTVHNMHMYVLYLQGLLKFSQGAC